MIKLARQNGCHLFLALYTDTVPLMMYFSALVFNINHLLGHYTIPNNTAIWNIAMHLLKCGSTGFGKHLTLAS